MWIDFLHPTSLASASVLVTVRTIVSGGSSLLSTLHDQTMQKTNDSIVSCTPSATKNTEFERHLHKHATETGLPAIVDFFSDGCGPCRMMAPIYKKLAHEVGQDKAVFVKVDTNAQYGNVD